MRRLLLIIILMGLMAGYHDVTAKERSYFYYVVVGVFKHKENAVKYTSIVKEQGLKADFGYHPKRQYYYVFTYYHPNKTDAALVIWAIRESDRIRNAKILMEAWVFGTDQLDHFTHNISQPEPVTPDTTPVVSGDVNFGDIRITEEEPEKEQLMASLNAGISSVEKKEETKKEIVKYHTVYLNTYNSATLDKITAKVQLLDVRKDMYLGLVDAHKYLKIEQPNKSGDIKLVFDTFGYRERAIEINLEDPLQGDNDMFIEQMGDTLVVDFELARYMVGDLVTMYKVYFFLDAALIRPGSKEEMNVLRNMLLESPGYKIRLHGHTNGGSFGKIIYPVNPQDNFFDIHDEVQVSQGSAKELSLARANTMKNWLVSQGIDENRITTRGWGAKRMLYPENSIHADKNVRVEVEIVKD